MKQFPFVPIKITDENADWFNYYTLNCNVDDAKEVGAPFHTEEAAQLVCNRLNELLGIGGAK